MRLLAVALLALLATLALAPAASGHGDEIIGRAVDGLRSDPVYVDETAVPSLAPAEAERLRERIRAAGGGIYVAILPADAQHELPTADAVVAELAGALGPDVSVAVLVGGQLRVASREHADEARALQAELVADASRPAAARLERFVARMGNARSGGSGGVLVVALAGAAVLGVLGLVVLARRRRAAPETAAGALLHSSRARRRSSVG